jgi:hypothetical protein
VDRYRLRRVPNGRGISALLVDGRDLFVEFQFEILRVVSRPARCRDDAGVVDWVLFGVEGGVFRR